MFHINKSSTIFFLKKREVNSSKYIICQFILYDWAKHQKLVSNSYSIRQQKVIHLFENHFP